MYTAENLRIERICRVCLNENEEMKCLFEGSLSEKLQELAAVQIQQNDGLPSLLCASCVHALDRCHSFRLQAATSDRTLRAIQKARETAATNATQPTTTPNRRDTYPNEAPQDAPALQPPTSFTCDICKKQVKTIHSLRRHMRIHAGVKPHACSICGRTFTEPGNLSKHERRHTDDKKHQCNECGLRFYERNKLTIHIRTHTGEKPYACEVVETVEM